MILLVNCLTCGYRRTRYASGVYVVNELTIRVIQEWNRAHCMYATGWGWSDDWGTAASSIKDARYVRNLVVLRQILTVNMMLTAKAGSIEESKDVSRGHFRIQ